KLLSELERLGLAKDTLVIFVNDNGGERVLDKKPLFPGKYTLWGGGNRVPRPVRGPRGLPPRAVSGPPGLTRGPAPPPLSAAGIARVRGSDGEDVLPILAGKAAARERTFFWRLRLPGEPVGQRAVRRGKWKYVLDRRVELLFDLDADPGERRTLAYR